MLVNYSSLKLSIGIFFVRTGRYTYERGLTRITEQLWELENYKFLSNLARRCFSEKLMPRLHLTALTTRLET